MRCNNNNDIQRWSTNVPIDDCGVVNTTSIENIKIMNSTFDVANQNLMFNKRNSRNFSSTIMESEKGTKMNSTITCMKSNTIEFNTATRGSDMLSP